MEQALRVQEQEQANLASLADSMAAGLVMIGANGEISYYSAQVGEILGKAPQDLLLTNQASLEAILSQSAEDQDATLAKFRGLSVAADSSRTANLVLALPRKKVLRCSMFPVRDTNNRDLGKGLLLSDITKEFEVEQMKDEFIGMPPTSSELHSPVFKVSLSSCPRALMPIHVSRSGPDASTARRNVSPIWSQIYWTQADSLPNP